MKLRVSLFVLTVVLMFPLFMSAQAIITPFTGETVTKTVFTDFGTFFCPGGEPAGPFPPNAPCSPGSRVNFRGVVFQHSEQATDSRMTGTMQIVFNGNTDGWTLGPPVGPGSGPVWGTWHMDVTEGGVWDGTYTGDRTVTSSGAVLTLLHFVGEGSGGNLEGLKVRFDVGAPHTTTSTMKGWILAPPNSK